jgi:hypothetical protein
LWLGRDGLLRLGEFLRRYIDGRLSSNNRHDTFVVGRCFVEGEADAETVKRD